MTTKVLLKLAELKTEITTQRLELSEKFKDIDERLRAIEEPVYRIDEREKDTRKIADAAMGKAEKAERLAWIGFGGGSAGAASSLARIVGLL
jgi:hypothetical protein